MARPGIMLYFDILEPIRVLPDEDKGRLLVAMLEYGQLGTLPEFDGMLALAWGFVKPKIDKDQEAYENSCVQSAYATFCRERKKRKLSKIPFEEWTAMDDDERKRMISDDIERYQAISDDDYRYPTTTTSTTTKTNTTTSTTTAAATNTTTNDGADGNGNEDKVVRAVGGTLGKGVVFMSDEQVDDLLDKMGIEAFDHYVDKLSEFIITNGARVKNHYETILKWWREDSRLEQR